MRGRKTLREIGHNRAGSIVQLWDMSAIVVNAFANRRNNSPIGAKGAPDVLRTRKIRL